VAAILRVRLGGRAPAQRRRVRQLPLRRGRHRPPGRLRRPPAAAHRPQGPLGPGRRVPHERQHRPPAAAPDRGRRRNQGG